MNLRTRIQTNVIERVPDEQDRPDTICLKARAVAIFEPRNPERFPDGWRIAIHCPYCGKTHYHGWRAPGGELKEQRSAHCVKGRELYPNYRWHEYRIDATHLEGGA